MSGIQNQRPITVTAEADRNFVTLLNGYKHLKEIKKITLICLLLVAMVPFAWVISAVAVFVTLALCLGTLAYVVISQEQVLSEQQRALYSICLKSVSDQVDLNVGGVDPSQD